MELQDALSQIAQIRRQVARVEWYRGYRAAPVAFSGVLAVAAAIAQAVWLPKPTHNVGAYLALWVSVAAISALAAGLGIVLPHQEKTTLPRTMTRLAIEQFLPCVVAGALLTIVVVTTAPEAVGLLPGLWAIIFSLGVFASCRLLPGAIGWVGAYYLLAGLTVLAAARGSAALAPWAMAVPFGGGQLLTALILYRSLEQR